jgi:Fibronectin type III domain
VPLGALGVLVALSLAGCGQVGEQIAAPRSTPSQLATPQGSATLNWTPVTQNTNGTLVVGLAGYEILFGSSANALTEKIVLSDPAATSYVVADLPPGTWYFSVAAFTADGTTGDFSNVAAKTIN